MSEAPRLLLVGDEADPLVVVRSHFWNFNAVGLYHGDQACVIDPGIEPRDIDALRAAVCGSAGDERSVTQVVLTHSHHDHIRGWMRFPGAGDLLAWLPPWGISFLALRDEWNGPRRGLKAPDRGADGWKAGRGFRAADRRS